MAIQQPISTDFLNSPDHSLSHRVFANDNAAPAQSIVVDSAGNVGIGTTGPTAYLNIKAGTATAGTAPLKLTAGVLNTAPEVGALEFVTDTLSFTITSGAARKTIAFLDSPITSSMYIGTTSVALNRGTGALSLAGVSIDGNAGTVTNGIYTTSQVTALTAVTSAGDKGKYLYNDPTTGALSWATVPGGTVTTIGVTTANGVSGTSSGGATPSLTLTLGAITPTTVNGLALSRGVNSLATNVAVGASVLEGANSGNAYNTAIGNVVLQLNTSGESNTAIGSGVLATNTTGGFNVGIGRNALGLNDSGSENSAVGYAAGYNALGSANVFIGAWAGTFETGSASFYVNNQNRTNTAGDKAGSLLYGTFNATPSSQTLRVNASLSVLGLAGTGTRAVLADANGLLSAPVSDISLKRNLYAIDKPTVMAMLSDPEIRALNYQWKDTTKGEDVELGFTANMFWPYREQIKGLVFEDNGIKGLNYDRLTALLWTQNVEQQNHINELESRIKMLESK